MKVRSSLRKRFGDVEYVEPRVIFPENRANQAYTSRANLIFNFLACGSALTGSSQGLYDFPDGKDDGSDVPVWRDTRVQAPELYQMSISADEKASVASQTILDAYMAQQPSSVQNPTETPINGGTINE